MRLVRRDNTTELTCKNAARGPHVDRGCVELGAEEHVRRAVPQRHHFGRVAPHRDAERARQPKVGQLQLAALVDQQVLRLQVAVEDVAAVAVREAAQQLEPAKDGDYIVLEKTRPDADMCTGWGWWSGSWVGFRVVSSINKNVFM